MVTVPTSTGVTVTSAAYWPAGRTIVAGRSRIRCAEGDKEKTRSVFQGSFAMMNIVDG